MSNKRSYEVIVRMEPTDKPTPEQLEASRVFWKKVLNVNQEDSKQEAARTDESSRAGEVVDDER